MYLQKNVKYIIVLIIIQIIFFKTNIKSITNLLKKIKTNFLKCGYFSTNVEEMWITLNVYTLFVLKLVTFYKLFG